MIFGSSIVAHGLHPPLVADTVELHRPASSQLDRANLFSSFSVAPTSWIGASTIQMALVTLCSNEHYCEQTLDQYEYKAPPSASTSTIATISSNTYQTWKKDNVVRIVDANTVKLEKEGLVSLAGIQMPMPSSTFQFPDCFDKAPSYEIRKLLPAKMKVRVQVVTSSMSPPNALIAREDDGILVNAALVEAGFGRLKERSARQAETYVPDITQTLATLQQRAKILGAGIYQSCSTKREESDISASFVEATFEPLQPETTFSVPPNPGDRRNCADFETYEEALKYYETFYPYYGDVAKLDRDHDGVPCPGLAHTKKPDLYRMKVPWDRKGKSLESQ